MEPVHRHKSSTQRRRSSSMRRNRRNDKRSPPSRSYSSNSVQVWLDKISHGTSIAANSLCEAATSINEQDRSGLLSDLTCLTWQRGPNRRHNDALKRWCVVEDDARRLFSSDCADGVVDIPEIVSFEDHDFDDDISDIRTIRHCSVKGKQPPQKPTKSIEGEGALDMFREGSSVGSKHRHRRQEQQQQENTIKSPSSSSRRKTKSAIRPDEIRLTSDLVLKGTDDISEVSGVRTLSTSSSSSATETVGMWVLRKSMESFASKGKENVGRRRSRSRRRSKIYSDPILDV